MFICGVKLDNVPDVVARYGNGDERRKAGGLDSRRAVNRHDWASPEPKMPDHRRPAASRPSICCGAYDYGKYDGGVPDG